MERVNANIWSGEHRPEAVMMMEVISSYFNTYKHQAKNRTP